MSQSLALDKAFERALEAIPARVLHGGLAVAYSGGLDSTVLLHLAAEWARRRDIAIHALHVHHGLSPNADAWALHCQQVCAALQLPCQILRVQVMAEGEGLEQAARHARYAALFSACHRLGACALLCAHHQDDQAETVLLNLLRGSGVAGLGGMHHDSLRGDTAVHLLRPLLDQPRSALQAFAQARGLSWVEDESNQALHLRRNLVRHVLLPAVEEQFPAAASVLARSAAHLRSARNLLDQLAAIDMQANSREQGRALDLAGLSALPSERIDNVLRFWLRQQGSQVPGSARLEELRVQMLHAGQDRHPQWQLGNLLLLRSGGTIRIAAAMPPPPAEEISLNWQGESRLAVPAWHGALHFTATDSAGLPAAMLQNALRIAPRAGGERLQIHPRRPSRSLKNLYQEHALPAWQRPFLPLVYGADVLLFAAGLGMDCRPLQDGPGYLLHWESDPSS